MNRIGNNGNSYVLLSAYQADIVTIKCCTFTFINLYSFCSYQKSWYIIMWWNLRSQILYTYSHIYIHALICSVYYQPPGIGIQRWLNKIKSHLQDLCRLVKDS